MSEEEGVIINVEGQRQAMSAKSTIQKIQMSQESFSMIEASRDVVASGVIEQIKQDMFLGLERQPKMGRSVILPQGAKISSLPAFDRLGCFFITSIRSQMVFDGPAANAGAVGFELAAPQQFAGDGVVRNRWFGGKEFTCQSSDFCWPSRLMIATGGTRNPSVCAALSTSFEILVEELVKASPADLEFFGRSLGRNLLSTEAG